MRGSDERGPGPDGQTVRRGEMSSITKVAMLGLGDWAGSYCLCLEQMGNVIPPGPRQEGTTDHYTLTSPAQWR